jgi:hypothetical protein
MLTIFRSYTPAIPLLQAFNKISPLLGAAVFFPMMMLTQLITSFLIGEPFRPALSLSLNCTSARRLGAIRKSSGGDLDIGEATSRLNVM